MNELRELYQELILDHAKNPRNFGSLEGANRHAEGHNPLCGDMFSVFLVVQDGQVLDAKFQGHGCAISTASASMTTEAIRGKTVEEAKQLLDDLHGAIMDSEPRQYDFDRLNALMGVKEFPMRVKCATLAWHAVQAALEGDGLQVSTE